MAQVAGITIDRTQKGIPTYAHINLRKHSYFIPFLEQNGIEVEQPIKWTAKMKQSFQEAKNGEWSVGDINNFWRE
jgi:hypothetical protein